MNRNELFDRSKTIWKEKNEMFFGMPLETDDFISDEIFKEYADKFWNNEETRCELCKKLFENNQDNNMNDFIPYNSENPDSTGFFIGSSPDYNVVYGWFNYNSKIQNFPVFLIPKILPNLEWKTGSAEYVPRGTAKRNFEYMNKIDNTVNMPGRFEYNCSTKTITEKTPGGFNSSNFDEKTIKYLKAFCPDFEEGEDIKKFEDHLQQLPDTKYTNLINYNFYDFNIFFKGILNKCVKINPIIKKPGNISSILTSLGRKKGNSNSTGKRLEDESDECTLILDSERSNTYALSNFRSVLYTSNSFSDKFFFSETELFFDAFKTVTSNNAGKLRTLLDDVFVGDDGLLYKELPNGEVLNQFEAYKRFFIDGDKSVKTDSLSCLSKTIYCSNNAPKRIMMTAKSIGQSVPINPDIEYDKNIHSVLAKVVFGDFYGLTNGDALVISKSFAKKMTSHKQEKIFIQKSNARKCEIYNECWDQENSVSKRNLTIDEFAEIIGYSKNDFKRYNNIHIRASQEIKRNYGLQKNRFGYNIIISYDIPVKEGDKFTNLHGSKGTISCVIVDDNKMPKLIEPCGVMKAGPFDIIISSYSISKRGNIGQICEAFARMKGINEEIPLKELFADADKYSKPLIEYDGRLTEKSFGLQEIIRLHHLSISHASFSSIDKHESNLVNFGEQENLFLIAHDLKNIQKEINQRSPKYFNRKKNTDKIILNKSLIDSSELNYNMELLGVFYSFGYDTNIIEE